MTSQRFSSNKLAKRYDLRQAFKSVLPATIIAFFDLLYRRVIAIAAELSSYNMDTYYDASKAPVPDANERLAGVNLVGEVLGISTIFELAILGGLFALFAFAPFMRKRNANFYLSSPVTRADLFKNRVVASLVSMTGVLAVTLFLDTIVNCYYLNTDSFIIQMAFAIFFESIVCMFVAFGIIAIGMSAASNILQGVIFGVGLYGLPSGIALVMDWLSRSFLDGYFSTSLLRSYDAKMFGGDFGFIQPSLLVKLAPFNPALIDIHVGADYFEDGLSSIASQIYTDYTPFEASKVMHYSDIRYYIPSIIWSVLFVAIIFVAKSVFVHRKSDNIGMIRRNKGIIAFVVTELALGVSTVWINEVSFDNLDQRIVRALIVIAVFVVAWIGLYSLFTHNIKHSKGAWTCFGVMCVLLVGTMGVMSAGCFGYSSYVPDVDDIEYAAITGTGISGDMCSLDSGYDIFPDYVTNNKAMAVLTDPDDLQTFTDVNEALITGDRNVDNSIVIKYQLKNGKKVYRAYDEVSVEGMALVPSIVDTKAYRENLYYYLTGEGENTIKKNITDNGFNENYFFEAIVGDSKIVTNRKLTPFDCLKFDEDGTKIYAFTDAPEIGKVLVADLKNMTYKDLFFNDSAPIGFVALGSMYEDFGQQEDVVRSYDDYNELTRFYIYPTMTNTIEYLKSVGLYDAMVEGYADAVQFDKVYVARIGDKANQIRYCGTVCGYGPKDSYFDECVDPETIMKDYKLYTDKAIIDKCLESGVRVRYTTADDYIAMFMYEDKDGIQTKILVIPSSQMSNIK